MSSVPLGKPNELSALLCASTFRIVETNHYRYANLKCKTILEQISKTKKGKKISKSTARLSKYILNEVNERIAADKDKQRTTKVV